jgi:hypothetical protein
VGAVYEMMVGERFHIAQSAGAKAGSETDAYSNKIRS